MTDLHFQSATNLLAALQNKDTSSSELVELFFQRYQQHNPALNAIVDTDFDGALSRAREADEARTRGESWGALHGLPMTLKDSVLIKGFRSTFGSEIFKDHTSEFNADFVDTILGAGAIVLGKTNLPLWGEDTQTFNAVYGQTNNPFDVSRTPGGSSGGSAVALAAGLTGLEIGSDIGGSIRCPAHYCGVYGHKPSYGIVPTRGTLAPNFDSLHDYSVPLDLLVSGPLARSAEDLELIMDLIVAPPASQRKAYKLELPPARRESIKDYRIGIWIEDPLYGPDQEVGDRLQDSVDRLAAAGAQIIDKRPDIDFAESAQIFHEILTLATVHLKTQSDFDEIVKLSKQQPTKATADLIAYCQIQTSSHRDWSLLNVARARLRQKWDDYFKDVDVMLCPASRVAAFPHDPQSFGARRNNVDGEDIGHWETVMPWAGLTILPYLPATVAPTGLTPGGLPVGVQIVGPYLEDRTPMHVAHLMEDIVGGFAPPPGFE